MFIIETLQANGTWWPFRYKLFGGDIARFNSKGEACRSYILWKGSVKPYGTNWRIVAV